MTDLDQLSREVAAAGDGWMVPGVQVVTPDGESFLFLGRKYGAIIVLGKPYGIAPTDIRPNLRDPVTVNALLEDRQVYANAPTGGEYWLCYPASEPIGGKSWLRCDTRTEAICRAWIAARGKR